jgi:hypothetical protein
LINKPDDPASRRSQNPAQGTKRMTLSSLCTSALCGCPTSHGLTRRGLLKGGAAAVAVGASGLTPRFMADAVAQTPAHRIDVHHHVSPPTWLDAVKSMKQDNVPMATWSIQKTLDDMDKGGVATAITSPTTPQVTGLDVTQAARVARESNEYAKKLETDYKGRFGTWAMLPFPHVDACLKEIEYAFDTLKVDGVGCMTSYGDKWLGYREFEPVWPNSTAARQRSIRIRPAPIAASIWSRKLAPMMPISNSVPTRRARSSPSSSPVSARNTPTSIGSGRMVAAR